MNVSQPVSPVNLSPRNGGWGSGYVTARRDGSLYRWYRFTGIQGYTSQDAFVTLAEATEAAQSIAYCYKLPYRAEVC